MYDDDDEPETLEAPVWPGEELDDVFRGPLPQVADIDSFPGGYRIEFPVTLTLMPYLRLQRALFSHQVGVEVHSTMGISVNPRRTVVVVTTKPENMPYVRKLLEQLFLPEDRRTAAEEI